MPWAVGCGLWDGLGSEPKAQSPKHSRHWMSVRSGISPGHEMLELPLDIREERARAEAEEIGAQPAVAQLLLHQIEVLERLLRRADAAGRLESDRIAAPLVVLANHARHHEREGHRRVDALLPRRGLDEVRTGLHRHDARARDVA